MVLVYALLLCISLMPNISMLAQCIGVGFGMDAAAAEMHHIDSNHGIQCNVTKYEI